MSPSIRRSGIHMIAYMPFTHIEEPHLKMLSGVFGAITVYSPAQTLVPEQMEQWAQEELLEIRHPVGVDGERLTTLVREYKAWAEMHQGNLGDVAGFLKSRPERFVLMEETNPSQIREQVRHYGEPPVQAAADPLYDAALFLSLAQEFDRQQYAMDLEMDAVQKLEREMMQQISGDDTDAGVNLPLGITPRVSSRDQSLSPDMLPQRIRAWALLALCGGDASWLYISPSTSVVEHIVDRFAEGAEVYRLPMSSNDRAAVSPPERIREMIRGLNLDGDREMIEQGVEPEDAQSTEHLRLVVHRIPNLAPRTFLSAMAGDNIIVQSMEPSGDEPPHTMIGVVTVDTL